MARTTTHHPDPVRWAAYVLDLLDDDRRAEMDAHLTACEACASMVEGIRMIALESSAQQHASPAALAEWLRATPARRAAAMTDITQHLTECAACSREAEIIGDALSHAADAKPSTAGAAVLKGAVEIVDGVNAKVADVLRALVAPVFAEGGVVWGIPVAVRGQAASAQRAYAIEPDAPAVALAEVAVIEIRSMHGESVRMEKTLDGSGVRLSSPRFATGAPAAGIRVFAHIGDETREVATSHGGEATLTFAAVRDLAASGGIVEIVLTPEWAN